MMHRYSYQRGATLFVALVLLLIMTLFAISSINLSTVNLRIVNNMQARKDMDAASQDAVEQVISDPDKFATPSATTVTSTIGGVGYAVNVSAPTCIDSQTASGYSAVIENVIPEDNTWEVTASVNDNVTGASATTHQGIELRMLAGNCPDP